MLLLERDAELAGTHHEIVGSTDDSGQIIFVEGPSGIGKSSLLPAADTIGRDLGAQVLTTSGGELEREHPFRLIRRLLEQRAARAEPDERKTLFRGDAGVVESLLQPATFASGPSLPDEFQLIHSLYWLVVNIADDKPLVLLADDLHGPMTRRCSSSSTLPSGWVTCRSRLWLRSVPAIPRRRTSWSHVWVFRADRSIRPRELSRDAIRQLLGVLLPEGLDSGGALVDDSLRATRGNPFLLRELASGTSARPDASLASVRTTAPASVARSVMLRLSRCGGDAAALARAASPRCIDPVVSGGAARPNRPRRRHHRHRSAGVGRSSPTGPSAFYHPIIRSAGLRHVPTGRASPSTSRGPAPAQ